MSGNANPPQQVFSSFELVSLPSSSLARHWGKVMLPDCYNLPNNPFSSALLRSATMPRLGRLLSVVK